MDTTALAGATEMADAAEDASASDTSLNAVEGCAPDGVPAAMLATRLTVVLPVSGASRALLCRLRGSGGAAIAVSGTCSFGAESTPAQRLLLEATLLALLNVPASTPFALLSPDVWDAESAELASLLEALRAERSLSLFLTFFLPTFFLPFGIAASCYR